MEHSRCLPEAAGTGLARKNRNLLVTAASERPPRRKDVTFCFWSHGGDLDGVFFGRDRSVAQILEGWSEGFG